MNKRQAKKNLKKRKGYITPRGAEPRKCEAFTDRLIEIMTRKIGEAIKEIDEKIIRGEV